MASKKQTITNFFKPCNNEKPSSETSKSSDLIVNGSGTFAAECSL